MIETVHKCWGDYVILRFDENEKDRRTNWRTEYRTWAEWKPWLKNAKKYWFEDVAAQALVGARILHKNKVW